MVRTPYDTLLGAFEFVGMVRETRYSVMARSVILLLTVLNRINGKTRGVFPFRHNLMSIPGG